MHEPARVAELTVGRRGRVDVWIEEPRPRLRWRIESSAPDWRQLRAEIELRTDIATEVATIEGDSSIAVEWPFDPLTPRRGFALRVRVMGGDRVWSAWSDPVDGVPGFLADGAWRAEAIGLRNPHGRAQPALVGTSFSARPGIRRATLYATALGAAEWQVNGRAVAPDDVLSPGWTPYDRRLVHATWDATRLVVPGRNAIVARLAGAWYTEQYGWGPSKFSYGEQPRVAAELWIDYVDGSSQVLRTDRSWRCSDRGETMASGLYAGEIADLRLAGVGSGRPSDIDDWPLAVAEDLPVAPDTSSMPPTRRIERIPVADVLDASESRVLLDFGQNLVGRLRLALPAAPGHRVRVRHAEVLDGTELFTLNLREAAATDEVILGETGTTWEPRFTFHGFRFAEITGWPGPFDPGDVTAIVLHADMRRTGWFESSSPLLDRLHENVVWGMRGNFLALPTDCPQRDERFGWTGDIQVFAATAAFLYDCEGFLASWLRDLVLEQSRTESGAVPNVVPDVFPGWDAHGTAVWGDAATIVPSAVHDAFGDPRILADQIDSMRSWVAYEADRAGEDLIWEGDFQFGDWMAPGGDEFGTTDPDLVATAYVAASTSLLARSHAALGDPSSARAVAERAADIRRAWIGRFATAYGRLSSDTATAYALAIAFDLTDDEGVRAAFGDRLRRLVADAGHRITTGFVGTPIVCDALTRTGHADDAARLLLQTERPSWLGSVLAGATTMWERWDGIRDDGTPHPDNSFNHYAFGAIAAWLHRSVAGLSPRSPGYREILIAPVPLPGLDFARARHLTPAGMAESSWTRREDGRVEILVIVPPNCRALIRLPGRVDEWVGSGTHVREVTNPSMTSGGVGRDPREMPPGQLDADGSGIGDRALGGRRAGDGDDTLRERQ